MAGLTVVKCSTQCCTEILNGDPPHAPRGCIAQAWTVAEVLRAWEETADGGQPNRADRVGERVR